MKKSIFKRLLAGMTAVALSGVMMTGCGNSTDSAGSDGSEGGSVKVGLLHSLTGSMAISEKAVRDAEVLAIEEINKAGGVLGKQIEAVEEDGASEPSTFATKAEKLLKSFTAFSKNLPACFFFLM